jgi:hypothetical protein
MPWKTKWALALTLGVEPAPVASGARRMWMWNFRWNAAAARVASS